MRLMAVMKFRVEQEKKGCQRHRETGRKLTQLGEAHFNECFHAFTSRGLCAVRQAESGAPSSRRLMRSVHAAI